MKSTGVYVCPDDTTNGTVANPAVVSYAFNMNLTMPLGNEDGGGANWATNGSTTKLTAPSVTLALVECVGGVTTALATPGETNSPAFAPTSFQCGFGNCTFLRLGDGLSGFLLPGASGCAGGSAQCEQAARPMHTSGANYLLCDGHVKWLPATKVCFGYNPKSATAGYVCGGVPAWQCPSDQAAAVGGLGAFTVTSSPL